jgi:hypothetical protein
MKKASILSALIISHNAIAEINCTGDKNLCGNIADTFNINYNFSNTQIAIIIVGLLVVVFVVLFFNRKPNYDENETVKLLLAHHKQQLDVKDEQIKNITAAVRAVHDKGSLAGVPAQIIS